MMPPESRRFPDAAGFSLPELLVAMAVVGIFMGGVLSLFVNFLGESGEQAALSKRGLDARLGFQLVRRDLANAGFGIATGDLSGAVTGTGTSVTIRSTAIHTREEMAGTHGPIMAPGSACPSGAGERPVADGMGGCLDDGLRGVAMTPDRDFLEDVASGSAIDAAEGNLFFVGNQDDGEPYYFERTYELSVNPGSECAGGSHNLQFDDTNGSAGGVVDCVLDFRIRYGFELTDGSLGFTTDPDAPPGSAVDPGVDMLKAALVVQAGSEYQEAVSPASLQYRDSDFSGITVNLDSEQRRYQWRRVEWAVSLEDMD